MPQPQVPPTQPPVQNPPIVINVPNQPNNPSPTNPTYNQNTNTDSKSDSDSESSSRSSNSVSNINSTTQINNNLNYYENRGLKLPTTSLTINGYANQNDYGIVVGVSIPLGNRGSHAIKRQMEYEADTVAYNNASLLASVCSNLQAAGVTIDWSDPEVAAQFASLKSCRGITIKSETVAQAAPEDITKLRAELDAMRKEIQTYRDRVNVTAPQVQTTIPALW